MDVLRVGIVVGPVRERTPGAPHVEARVPGDLLGDARGRHVQVEDLYRNGARHGAEAGRAARKVGAHGPALAVRQRAQGDEDRFSGDEVRRLDAVPGREDAGIVRGHAFVHRDAPRGAQGDPRGFGEGRVRPDAHGHYGQVGLHGLAAGREADAVVGLFDGFHGGSDLDLDVLAFEVGLQRRRHLGIQNAGHETRRGLEDHGLGAPKRGRRLGQLEPDEAGAHDGHAAHLAALERHAHGLGVMEGFEGDDLLALLGHAGQADGARARGQDQLVVGQLDLGLVGERAAADDPRLAIETQHLGAGEHGEVLGTTKEVGIPQHAVGGFAEGVHALDVAGHEIGHAAGAVRDVLVPVHDGDLRTLNPPPRPRRCSEARRRGAHHHDVSILVVAHRSYRSLEFPTTRQNPINTR